MLLAVPPIFLIALYDYATMSMRATDEQMMTSEVAKWKQGVLFTALVLFLVAIAFRDAAGYFGNDTLVWCLDMTYCVFLVGGILTLWQALRLTAESARSYFRSSTDPRAQEWARVALIAFVLRRI
jgi:protein-S-isoprenylcysteine O-methyltransferase Ste14